MQITIADAQWNRREAQTYELAYDPGFGQLDERAREQLFDGEDCVLPWNLALALLDAVENDEYDDAWRRRRCPNWLCDEDADLLTVALLDAGLPAATGFRLRLSKRGLEGRAGYQLDAVWADEQGRPLPRPLEREGLFLREPGGELCRPTHGQHRLLFELEHLTGLGSDRQSDFMQAHRLAHNVSRGDGGVVVDRTLREQQVVYVDSVEPRLRPSGDHYELRPHVEGLSDEVLQPYFDAQPPECIGEGIHAVRGRGLERTRVVFDETSRRALKHLRESESLTPQQAASVLSRPEDFFDPSEFDLSAFSERVTGLGPAIQVVVPAPSKGRQREWFAGEWDDDAGLAPLGGEERGGGDAAGDLTEEQRETVGRLVEEADARGDSYIPNPAGPGLIQIDARLRSWLDRAPQAAEDRVDEQVLQVETNVTDVGFSPGLVLPGEEEVDAKRPPRLLDHIELRPHQEKGFRWLTARGTRAGERCWQGALLADDMGLGKTLQVLSFLDMLAEEGRPGPHLVVAPVALLDNWEEEARKFFGSAFGKVLIAASGRLPQGSSEHEATYLESYRLVLVSYETLARRELLFGRVRWDTVILDEAQKAKNPTTRIARVVRALRARFRLAMTGTPVENRLQELWTVYDWALPGLLGSLHDFNDTFVRPLDAASRAERIEVAEQLYGRIEPVFCRRMKADVLAGALPEKREHDHGVSLSAEQERVYGALVAQARQMDKPNPLALLSRLFGVCAHPDLGGPAGRLPGLAERDFPKARKLFELLDSIAERGERALVFANRKALQHWLSEEIRRRYRVSAPVINGDVTGSRRRHEIVKSLERQLGFGALVLSPRAAGVGLNITAANHVIHYTREWNPAVENQATDRVYRMGQKRDVHVHTITTRSNHGRTAEQHLADLLESKRALMADFVVPTESFAVSDQELASRVLGG